MSAPPPFPAPRLPGYDLSPLTDGDVRAMLQRVFGTERSAAIWTDACRRARLGSGCLESVAELERLADALAELGGAASIVARSIEIRLRTHARLLQRATGPAGARA